MLLPERDMEASLPADTSQKSQNAITLSLKDRAKSIPFAHPSTNSPPTSPRHQDLLLVAPLPTPAPADTLLRSFQSQSQSQSSAAHLERHSALASPCTSNSTLSTNSTALSTHTPFPSQEDVRPGSSTPSSASAITVVRLDEYVARLQAEGFGLPSIVMRPDLSTHATHATHAARPSSALPADPGASVGALDVQDDDLRKMMYGNVDQPSLRLASRHGHGHGHAHGHGHPRAAGTLRSVSDDTFHSMSCQDEISCRAHPHAHPRAAGDAVAPSGYERAATLPPSYVTGNPHTHTSTATRSAQPNTGIIHANDDGSSAIHPLLHRSNPQQRDGTSCSMPPAACMPEDIQRVSAFFGGVHFSPDLWANLRVCLRFGADAGRRRTFGTRGDRMLKLIVSTAEDILEENREMLGGSFQPPTKLIETDAELGKWAQSRMGDLTTGHLAGDEVRAYAGLFKGVCYFVYRSVGEAGTARALKYIGLGSEVST